MVVEDEDEEKKEDEEEEDGVVSFGGCIRMWLEKSREGKAREEKRSDAMTTMMMILVMMMMMIITMMNDGGDEGDGGDGDGGARSFDPLADALVKASQGHAILTTDSQGRCTRANQGLRTHAPHALH